MTDVERRLSKRRQARHDGLWIVSEFERRVADRRGAIQWDVPLRELQLPSDEELRVQERARRRARQARRFDELKEMLR